MCFVKYSSVINLIYSGQLVSYTDSTLVEHPMELHSKGRPLALPSNARTFWKCLAVSMEQHTLKDIKNYLNTNIYLYLDTSRGQSSNSNPYLNVVLFF